MQANLWEIATGTPLLLCSAVALMLISERLFCVIRKQGLGRKNNQEIFSALHQHNINAALNVLEHSNTGYQFVVDELIHHKSSSKDVRDEAIKIMLVRYSNQLKKRLSGLQTIAAMAPMLGLLGTIIGLMRSFRDIGISKGPVEPSIVADGLWQALSTTAAGMIIAVFCVLFHALIQSRIRRHLAEAADVLNHFSHCIQLEESQND